ncbi:porin family protein [Rhodobacteraceae bacterium RKSG542]|uniref:outer membrane protein n=1 Tax=Pseudovibrio flavus TaxID=2529854 RepID=UPI0012BC9525|nr:outer membrane beta-barrel protein [Pseudovibrio flavus]MTI16840.1 porin family protein [Pseudovibrio flavus]
MMIKNALIATTLLAPNIALADSPSSSGNWDGVHVGLKGGYGVFTGKDTVGNKGSIHARIAGAFAGYNHSFNNIVVGVEAEINATDYEAVSGSGLSRSTSKWNSIGTVRLGYDTGEFLPYVSAGVGIVEYEVKRFSDAEITRNTHIGLAVGAGFEAMITNNISARIDYKHLQMSKETFKFSGTSAFQIEGSQNLFTAGLAYNF